MRRIQVLLAVITVISLVQLTGGALAGDGKAQGQPFQYLQQQIDELKANGKAQGQPFQYLQRQIDGLKAQIEAIQLTPGPQGPPGPSGPPGSPGTPGTPGVPGTACWDLDANGVCNVSTEDTNLDGKCDALDCKGEPGSTGAIKVYDSSVPERQYLGILLGHSGPYVEIFIPSLKNSILINISGLGTSQIGAFSGEPPWVTVYFADSTCGTTNPTPYFDTFVGYIVSGWGADSLRYFLSTTTEEEVIPNYSILREGTCTPVAHDLGVTFQGIEIQRGDIPFTLPVTLPLVYE